MNILFSPSEGKITGGVERSFSNDCFLFPQLFDVRKSILSTYNDYVLNASRQELAKLFGSQKQSVIDYYSQDIFHRPTMKAIERYNGVGYEYLGYETLNEEQKDYIDTHTIIFSNLFGPLLAGDLGLPDYKLKQGEKIGTLAPEKLYLTHFTPALDAFLCNEPYLDLRAAFYHKFYKPSTPYTTVKFLKNGKIVSHWSKAFRGLILRQLAIQKIQSIDALLNMKLQGLKLNKVNENGIHREIIFETQGTLESAI